MIDGDTAKRIAMDVALEIPVLKSTLTYGPDEVDFRNGVEKRYKEMIAKSPKTMMVVPE